MLLQEIERVGRKAALKADEMVVLRAASMADSMVETKAALSVEMMANEWADSLENYKAVSTAEKKDFAVAVTRVVQWVVEWADWKVLHRVAMMVS